MAKTRHTSRADSTSRAIKAISRRVAALEQRLACYSPPAGFSGDAAAGVVWPARASQITIDTADATRAARAEAIRDFHQQAWRSFWKRNPQLREAMRRDHERLNALLKARGFEPAREPTD